MVETNWGFKKGGLGSPNWGSARCQGLDMSKKWAVPTIFMFLHLYGQIRFHHFKCRSSKTDQDQKRGLRPNMERSIKLQREICLTAKTCHHYILFSISMVNCREHNFKCKAHKTGWIDKRGLWFTSGTLVRFQGFKMSNNRDVPTFYMFPYLYVQLQVTSLQEHDPQNGWGSKNGPGTPKWDTLSGVKGKYGG